MSTCAVSMSRRHALVTALLLALPGISMAQAAGFDTAVGQWKSYEDVARWLKQNFVFDKSRLDLIISRTRQSGPAGLLARAPQGTFESKTGYCTDSANFALQALNRIDPEYQAKLIYIKNQYGQPHHWVTGFMKDGKIMVMDYGAGPEWTGVNGVHGPYDSLEQYAEFLRSLRIRRFSPESVEWRPVFPGQQD